jgi:hypothetical protein
MIKVVLFLVKNQHLRSHKARAQTTILEMTKIMMRKNLMKM